MLKLNNKQRAEESDSKHAAKIIVKHTTHWETVFADKAQADASGIVPTSAGQIRIELTVAVCLSVDEPDDFAQQCTQVAFCDAV